MWSGEAGYTKMGPRSNGRARGVTRTSIATGIPEVRNRYLLREGAEQDGEAAKVSPVLPGRDDAEVTVP